MISESLYKRYGTWVLLALALLGGFLVFWYSDIGDTLDNAVLLVESIVKGKFFDYYEYAALNSAPASQYSANYNILLYAIFAVWNLPTVIAHLVAEVDYMNEPIALLWCKLIIVAAYIGIFFVISKITKKLTDSDEDGVLAGFISISSLCVFVPALVACQYDCLSLLCMLLGIYFYSERKTLQFLVMFALAVPLKMFALFIFIPLILIRYKNVLKLAGMLISIMIPSILLELPFKADPYFSVAMDSQSKDAIYLLLDGVIVIDEIRINPFIVAFIVICFLCYMKKDADSISETYNGIYYSFATFAAFCALTPIRSYWIILFTPFLAILAISKKGNRTVGILADTIIGAAGGLYVLAHHWIYNTGGICNYLILWQLDTPLGAERKYKHFKGFLQSFGLYDLRFAFFAVFLGGIAFALWYFYPGRKCEKDDGAETSLFPALIARPAILAGVFVMLLYFNFATQPAVKYGSYECDGTSTVDIMDMDYPSIYRTVEFSSDETLSELTVYLQPWNVHRSARSFVGIRLVDTRTDKVIWEDKVGIAVIDTKTETVKFKLDDLKVYAGVKYRVEYFAIDSQYSGIGEVYPYVDPEGNLALLFR